VSDLPPVDAASDTAPVAPLPDAMTTAPAVELAPVGAAFPDVDTAALIKLGAAARENNASGTYHDTDGRDWAIMPDVVDSHSVVLVQMNHGGTFKNTTLSTVTFSTDMLIAACLSMAGM
jgi:hypothetical protein